MPFSICFMKTARKVQSKGFRPDPEDMRAINEITGGGWGEWSKVHHAGAKMWLMVKQYNRALDPVEWLRQVLSSMSAPIRFPSIGGTGRDLDYEPRHTRHAARTQSNRADQRAADRK